MRLDSQSLFKKFTKLFCRAEDPELDELRHDIEALDQYLRIQNLRRSEEERFLRLRLNAGSTYRSVILLAMMWMVPESAMAADLEQTLRNLVTVFTAKLLPVLAMGYLGKNIFAHINGDPNAKHETIRVVVAIACLIGLSGVWNLISQQVR